MMMLLKLNNTSSYIAVMLKFRSEKTAAGHQFLVNELPVLGANNYLTDVG